MSELYKIVFYGFSKDVAIDIDNKIKTKLGIMNGSIEHDDRFEYPKLKSTNGSR